MINKISLRLAHQFLKANVRCMTRTCLESVRMKYSFTIFLSLFYALTLDFKKERPINQKILNMYPDKHLEF